MDTLWQRDVIKFTASPEWGENNCEWKRSTELGTVQNYYDWTEIKQRCPAHWYVSYVSKIPYVGMYVRIYQWEKWVLCMILIPKYVLYVRTVLVLYITESRSIMIVHMDKIIWLCS